MKHRVGFTDDELLRIVRLLHKVALSRTRCPDKANDLVQNTVLRMLDKKYQFEAGTVLGAWGVVIMHRLWVQQCRRARREIKLFRPILAGRDGNTEFEIDFEESREVAALNQFDTEACYDAREKLRRIEEARIPVTHWEPLMGIALDGMEYQEMADRMGIKIGTVKSRVNRAREMINRELEKA